MCRGGVLPSSLYPSTSWVSPFSRGTHTQRRPPFANLGKSAHQELTGRAVALDLPGWELRNRCLLLRPWHWPEQRDDTQEGPWGLTDSSLVEFIRLASLLFSLTDLQWHGTAKSPTFPEGSSNDVYCLPVVILCVVWCVLHNSLHLSFSELSPIGRQQLSNHCSQSRPLSWAGGHTFNLACLTSPLRGPQTFQPNRRSPSPSSLSSFPCL